MNFIRKLFGRRWSLEHLREGDLDERFAAEDFRSIQAGCAAWANDYIRPVGVEILEQELTALWSPPAPPQVPFDGRFLPKLPDGGIRESKHAEIPSTYQSDGRWLFAMSKQFMKDVERIDRKIQGRILGAISELCVAPITPKGDTIKPLTGDRKNLWRYRLGDFRLVYMPDPVKRNVTLIAFASRGDVYE